MFHGLLPRKCLCHSESFQSGISNGAEWYVVDNGMQDYNYIFSNCMEVTAELSCSKKPPPEKLSVEWDNNLDSMLAFLNSVHGGVKGIVTDEEGNLVEGAMVEIRGKDKAVKTSPGGEYLRILLPGSYQISASHSNKFGVLEADTEQLEVVSHPGEGAVRKDLVLRLKLCQSFRVTTIMSGDELYYQEQLQLIFKDCDIVNISTTEKYYVSLREVMMRVTVRLNRQHIEEYCCQHYYDYRIKRFAGIPNISLQCDTDL